MISQYSVTIDTWAFKTSSTLAR